MIYLKLSVLTKYFLSLPHSYQHSDVTTYGTLSLWYVNDNSHQFNCLKYSAVTCKNNAVYLSVTNLVVVLHCIVSSLVLNTKGSTRYFNVGFPIENLLRIRYLY